MDVPTIVRDAGVLALASLLAARGLRRIDDPFTRSGAQGREDLRAMLARPPSGESDPRGDDPLRDPE